MKKKSFDEIYLFLKDNPDITTPTTEEPLEIEDFPSITPARISDLLRHTAAPYIHDKGGDYLINHLIRNYKKLGFKPLRSEAVRALAKPLLGRKHLDLDPKNNPIIVAMDAKESLIAKELLILFQGSKIAADAINHIIQNREYNARTISPILSEMVTHYFDGPPVKAEEDLINLLIKNQRKDIIELLLDPKQPIYSEEHQSLRNDGTITHRLPYDYKYTVKHILSSTDLTPAIKAGNVAICELLIKNGAKVSKKDFEALVKFGRQSANDEKILSLLAEKVTTIDTIPEEHQKEFFKKIFKIDLSRPDLHALYKETSEKKAKAPRHQQKLYGELLNSIDETHKDRSKEGNDTYLDEGSALYKLLEKNQFKALARIGEEQVKLTDDQLKNFASQTSPQLADASKQREKGGRKLVFKDLLNKAANFLNSLRNLNINSKDDLYEAAIKDIKTLIPSKRTSISR